jgi:hypothetical protein
MTAENRAVDLHRDRTRPPRALIVRSYSTERTRPPSTRMVVPVM